MLRDGVIESSSSPWRAQVVLVKSEHHRKRLCIDYSQTINMYTLLDAYPLPNVWDVVNNVAQYKWFSSLDLELRIIKLLFCLKNDIIQHSKLTDSFINLREYLLA